MRSYIASTAFLLIVSLIACSQDSSSSSSPSWWDGDPLVPYAWHLGNTGQTSFAQNGGIAGEDIKVVEAVALGYTGKGVRVAVSDSGLEITHEDIADNVLVNQCRDYRLPYPFGKDPTSTELRGDHGTSVAGLIAAVGWNGKGSRGVAPNAKVAGLNYLANPTTEVLLDQIVGDFDIFNQSWGYSYGDPGDGKPRSYIKGTDAYSLQIRYGVNRLRNGKGAIYVRSMGNDYLDDYRDTHPVSKAGNGDYEVVLPQHIMVGALNANGVKSSYSTTGSNIWISAPGGEYGINHPAMITIDQSSCDIGYSRIGATKNPFEGGHELNPDCNYTSTFNGTSSAAPVTSGVVALMLEANPDLTWRDVKHILAVTATQVDKDFQPLTHPLDPPGHINEPGWITNAAGFKFHNWYGFGRVNAEAAVKMARDYKSNWKTWQETTVTSDPLALPIPDFDKDGVTAVLKVTEDLKIEAVQLGVSITHPFTGDLGIELTSPSGTTSVLLHTNNSFNQPDLDDVILLSNAFYGELSQGDWKIRVVDGRATNVGTLTQWKLIISGRKP